MVVTSSCPGVLIVAVRKVVTGVGELLSVVSPIVGVVIVLLPPGSSRWLFPIASLADSVLLLDHDPLPLACDCLDLDRWISTGLRRDRPPHRAWKSGLVVDKTHLDSDSERSTLNPRSRLR